VSLKILSTFWNLLETLEVYTLNGFTRAKLGKSGQHPHDPIVGVCLAWRGLHTRLILTDRPDEDLASAFRDCAVTRQSRSFWGFRDHRACSECVRECTEVRISLADVVGGGGGDGGGGDGGGGGQSERSVKVIVTPRPTIKLDPLRNFANIHASPCHTSALIDHGFLTRFTTNTLPIADSMFAP
jgi:hypothetical protein